MKTTKVIPDDRFTSALEAIGALLGSELNEIQNGGWLVALSAHFEIEHAPVDGKNAAFLRHFGPWRDNLVSALTGAYRKLFKLTLAHPRRTASDPHGWAAVQLDPAVRTAIEWILEWYRLACDGARPIASVECLPGQPASVPIPTSVPMPSVVEPWRAPAWLFRIGFAISGIGPLKQNHVPDTKSEGQLGAAHTRLLLKGARRMFLWELKAAIENVKNEETAAAGFVHSPAQGREKRPLNKRKGWEAKLKLYGAIRKILSAKPDLQGMEFCAELDKRHAPPLYDWTKHGQWPEGLTWKEAWTDRRLRGKIRRVRQEALKSR